MAQNQNAKRNRKLHQRIDKQQRQLERRLDHRLPEDVSQPMFKASRIKYELADKTQAMIYGDIGLAHKLVKSIGLAESINKNLHLLKLNLPYHECAPIMNRTMCSIFLSLNQMVLSVSVQWTTRP